METPSSTRRVTRSQTMASQSNNNIPISRKIEDSDKSISKSRQRIPKQDRSALIDITNDSPIVGLAMGSLETPSSGTTKQKFSRVKDKTPGSGEAILRGQVKTLLQKVEEEAQLSKLSLEGRPFLHLHNSPMTLLAPTPANTPQILNLSVDGGFSNDGFGSVIPSPVVEEHLISQVMGDMFDVKKQEDLECEKNIITRSLLLDFSEKLESSDISVCGSVVTDQGEVIGESKPTEKPSPDEDDSSSVWSIQVNASNRDEDEEQIIEEEEEENLDGGLLDELCDGMNKININTEGVMDKFMGKHTRFICNSDDEIVEENDRSDGVSPTVLCSKGLPTPKGKHLRFAVEEDDGTDE